MQKISDFIVDKRNYILGFFLILCVICLFLSSKVKINRDILKYLPSTSETKIGLDIMEDEFTKTDGTLNLMFKGLKTDEKDKILQELKDIKGINEVNHENNSDYEKDDYTLYTITVDGDKNSKTATNVYQEIMQKYHDYEIYTSGDVSDENKVALPTWIVFLAIFCALIILMISCDSYIEPILFLIAVGMGVILNKGTNLMFPSISSITNAIAAILQLALSMDYSIMLVNRFRQEKMQEKNSIKAMKKALYASFSSISSSSVTTIVGLLALVFMSFTLGKDLGFVLAKGVLFSLLTIFTCLPALILMFEKLIIKTSKKSPKITLNFLAKFTYHFKYLGLLLFIIIFIASILLKGNLKILFTDVESDDVGKVFKTNNQIALVYKNENEDKMQEYCHKLESNTKITDVLCYGNTINEKLSYQDLNKKLKDLNVKTTIDDYLVKIIYYKYFNSREDNTMTMDEMLNFVQKNVYNNSNMNKKLDDEMKSNITKLTNFTNKEQMKVEQSVKNIANTLEIDENTAQNLMIYYDSLYTNTTISINEFIDFVNNYLSTSKYAQSIDTTKLSTIIKFSNKELLNKKMSYQEMANLFNMDESLMNNVYLYYLSLNDLNTTLSFTEFANFMNNYILNNEEYKENIDDNLKNKINLLQTFSQKDLINEKMSASMMAKLLNTNENLVNQAYQIIYNANGMSGDIAEFLLTPYEFISYISNNELLLSVAGKENIILLKSIMDSTLNDQRYSYMELASALNITDPNSIKNIYILYTLNVEDFSLNPVEFVNFLITHQEDETLKNNLNSKTLEELKMLNVIIQSVLNNESYSASSLANILNINKNDMNLLYGVYDINYKGKNIKLSYQEFINFLLTKVVNNKEYSKILSVDKLNKLNTLNTIMNNSLKDIKYNKLDMYNTLNNLKNIDQNLIDLIYIYYGSENNYDKNYQLTIQEFVDYLNSNIIKDYRFDDFIDQKTKNNIVDSKTTVQNAKNLLVGKNYSRIVLNTKYDLEGKDTFKFLQQIDNDLNKDVYLVGNSPMAYELDKTFDNELNFITFLTIIFIFIIVLITFKSFLIPTILVVIIQTSVYITMSLLSFESGSIYFIAILIVQSILMGATIDYAILYTSYYREYRRNMNVFEAVKNAYNNSIHTILTSASILAFVTLIIGHLGSATASKICLTISQGTICSTILILFILPSLICVFDKFIVKK